MKSGRLLKGSRFIIGSLSFLEGTPHNVSILTIYRPNFCSACGAKIIRLRWYLWTSRKFCDSCQAQFRKERFVQPLLLILLVLSVGVLLGRSTQKQSPPLVIQRTINQTTSGPPQTVETTTAEDVYICGARTKKGTPCSRRVHGMVRCWQHKGKQAVLPAEKLRIRE